jgi:hypothetical protein
MNNNRYRLPEAEGNPFRLGRHVNHDPRSRAYAFRAPRSATYPAVKHARHIPVFDQGDLGSCTGNAAVGCTGTGSFYAPLEGARLGFTWDEAGAVACYEAATAIDPYPGTYPPDDTGSDGTSVATALKNAGMISGYTHALTFDAAMAALQAGPVIFGLDWYENMFTPGADGTLKVAGSLAGGHEIVLDEWDPNTARVGLTNSWASDWGLGGRAYIQLADFKKLLARDGDVTVLVPLTAPAPTPTPEPGDGATAVEVAAAVRKSLTDLGL